MPGSVFPDPGLFFQTQVWKKTDPDLFLQENPGLGLEKTDLGPDLFSGRKPEMDLALTLESGPRT